VPITFEQNHNLYCTNNTMARISTDEKRGHVLQGGAGNDYGNDDDTLLIGKKSPGVQRIEILSQHLTLADRVFIFLSVFLIAYAYGLDGTLRYVYQVSLDIL